MPTVLVVSELEKNIVELSWKSCKLCEHYRHKLITQQQHNQSKQSMLKASPPRHPRTTWMKTITQDLKSNNLSLNEATDVAQNRPLWRLMSAFGTTHS